MDIIEGVFGGSIKYLVVVMIIITISLIIKSIIVDDEVKATAMDIAARFINRKDPISEIRIKKNRFSKIVQGFEVLTQQGSYYRVTIVFDLSRFMRIRPITKFSHEELSFYDVAIRNNSNDGLYHVTTINKEYPI